MPPRAAAARSLPCSLDAGCAGFYAGAWRAAARVPPRAAAARSLPCSLDAGGAGSDLARGGPSAIDITGNHGFGGFFYARYLAATAPRVLLRAGVAVQRFQISNTPERVPDVGSPRTPPEYNLRPHGRSIPDKRSREGRNVLFHSHEREQPTLPRIDPVAYKDQNKIASQLNILTHDTSWKGLSTLSDAQPQRGI